MNSKDLTEIMAKTSILANKCIGVFPVDMLHDVAMVVKMRGWSNFCLVVNPDEMGMTGSHWLALYVAGSHGEFFDSLGKPLSSYDRRITIFFAKVGCSIVTSNVNRFQLQGSVSCGKYCLYYLVYRTLGYSVRRILSSLSTFSREKNEEIVNVFLSKLIKHTVE